MQDNNLIFKAGDEIRPIQGREHEGNGCTNLADNYKSGSVAKLIVGADVMYDHLIRKWQALNANGGLVRENECALIPEYFEKVASANDTTMSSLTSLTKEQKAGLTADNQALLELGLINQDLTANAKGIEYLQKWLFAENRKDLAQVVKTEVLAIKAEMKKADTK